MHVFTLYLYFFKYLLVNTTVTNFCNYIYNYTVAHPLHLNPALNLPIPQNLSLNLPRSHLNTSKSVLQYNMNTNKYIVLIFWCKYIVVKAT